MSQVKISKAIVNYLQARGAIASSLKIRTRQISDAIGEPTSRRVLSALTKMEKTGIVEKHPRRTNPKPFLIRHLKGKDLPVDYETDCNYINDLARKNKTAAKILRGIKLSALKIRSPEDRKRYNQIIQRLHDSGFNGKLATYELRSGSYYWWLALNWSTKFQRFMKQKHTLIHKKIIRKS